MVILIKTIYKLFLIFLSFFVYDLGNVDSNNDKITILDPINIYDENKLSIYFKETINSNNIESIMNKYNIRISSYIIGEKKYYVRNIDELINKYTINMSKEDKIYYKYHGVNIDGLEVVCENGEIIKLSSDIKIY